MPGLNFKEISTASTFSSQLASRDPTPIFLFNIFEVPVEKRVDFLAYWQQDATYMKAQPGLLSIQFHEGTEGSGTFINIAHWESTAALAQAFQSEQFQKRLERCPEGITASPLIVKKLAVPGICVA